MSELTNFSKQDILADEERSKAIEKNKQKCMETVNNITESTAKYLTWYYTVTRNLSNMDKNIPNIGITAFNKINEFSKLFNSKDLSLYLTSRYTDSLFKQASSSFLGVSILNDMTSMCNEGMLLLIQFYKEFNSTYLLKKQENNKFFNKLKNHFKKMDIAFTVEDEKNLNFYIKSYKEIDTYIWNYDLRKRIPQAVSKQINSKGRQKRILLSLLLANVQDDLIQLGYDDIIPEVYKEVFMAKDPATGQFIQ